MKVAIIGVGKVGRGLHAALRAARVPASIVSARALVSRNGGRGLRGDVVVIAARDGAIASVVAALDHDGALSPDAIVVHCAGALDAEVLAPLRGRSAGVAQMHPMISFADPTRPPSLLRGHVHVAGDAEAVRRARKLARSIGMTPRTFPSLDRVAYHAAAGLVANGAAALAAAGADLLTRAGVAVDQIPAMLGPLLRSVAENVESMGLPAALTGPVRRGDVVGTERHLKTLSQKAPHLLPIYIACAQAQLPMARSIGDAPAQAFDDLASILARASGSGVTPS